MKPYGLYDDKEKIARKYALLQSASILRAGGYSRVAAVEQAFELELEIMRVLKEEFNG